MALTASNNLDASKSSDRLGAVEQALEALRNVIKSNPGMHVVDVLCVLFVCWIGLKITLHDVFTLDFCSQSLFEIIWGKKAPLRTHILNAQAIFVMKGNRYGKFFTSFDRDVYNLAFHYFPIHYLYLTADIISP